MLVDILSAAASRMIRTASAAFPRKATSVSPDVVSIRVRAIRDSIQKELDSTTDGETSNAEIDRLVHFYRTRVREAAEIGKLDFNQFLNLGDTRNDALGETIITIDRRFTIVKSALSTEVALEKASYFWKSLGICAPFILAYLTVLNMFNIDVSPVVIGIPCAVPLLVLIDLNLLLHRLTARAYGNNEFEVRELLSLLERQQRRNGSTTYESIIDEEAFREPVPASRPAST